MNESAAAARRAYKREWNRRNPEKVKAAQERYWSRRAAEAEAAAQAEAEQIPGQMTLEAAGQEAKAH